MSLLSFIALALGMAAAGADRVPTATALLAGDRPSCLSRFSGEMQEGLSATADEATRTAAAARHARLSGERRPLRRLAEPLRGAAAPRAPGARC